MATADGFVFIPIEALTLRSGERGTIRKFFEGLHGVHYRRDRESSRGHDPATAAAQVAATLYGTRSAREAEV